MRLYLIRHAQSANNALLSENGSYSGRSSDPEITAIGHQQSRLVAAHLTHPSAEPRKLRGTQSPDSGFGLTHLYCSLMTRSILTAQYIADACALPLVALPNIFERMGIFDLESDGTRTALPGRKRSYFEERFPSVAIPDSLDEIGWYNRPVETDEVFIGRVNGALAGLITGHGQSDDVVGMVVHGDFIDQFVNALMQVPRAEIYHQTIWRANWVFHNTSLTRVDFSADSKAVVYTNRIDHLSADLTTW